MPVATYGVVADRGPRADHSEAQDEVRDGESSALLGEDANPRGISAKPDGHAALAGSIGNLANTIIGSGMVLCSVRTWGKYSFVWSS